MVVSISRGNSKLGAIPSVSLPACSTCRPDAPCYKTCYARRLAARRENVRTAYYNNMEILLSDPALYWLQVRAAASMVRWFRFHVSGDLVNAEYWTEVVNTARQLPHTNFLIFTKRFEIVNDWLDAGGKIPRNLKVIFSNWFDWKCENPHKLPVCEVINDADEAPKGWKVCGGSCTACACRGCGCWSLKKGETIAIIKH